LLSRTQMVRLPCAGRQVNGPECRNHPHVGTTQHASPSKWCPLQWAFCHSVTSWHLSVSGRITFSWAGGLSTTGSFYLACTARPSHPLQLKPSRVSLARPPFRPWVFQHSIEFNIKQNLAASLNTHVKGQCPKGSPFVLETSLMYSILCWLQCD
jgi:hypothetical protein